MFRWNNRGEVIEADYLWPDGDGVQRMIQLPTKPDHPSNVNYNFIVDACQKAMWKGPLVRSGACAGVDIVQLVKESIFGVGKGFGG